LTHLHHLVRVGLGEAPRRDEALDERQLARERREAALARRLLGHLARGLGSLLQRGQRLLVVAELVHLDGRAQLEEGRELCEAAGRVIAGEGGEERVGERGHRRAEEGGGRGQ